MSVFFKFSTASERIVTSSGLSLVGRALSNGFKSVRSLFSIDPSSPEAQIPLTDIIRTAVGVLINGSPEYDAVSQLHDDDEFYARALDTSYTRIMMHQLYHPSANIDVLFVGSSHAYRALIPEIMDRELGAYTFNGGSSKQYLDGSFALIKEADKGNDLKQVCVELYYDIAETEPYAERTELTPT